MPVKLGQIPPAGNINENYLCVHTSESVASVRMVIKQGNNATEIILIVTCWLHFKFNRISINALKWLLDI